MPDMEQAIRERAYHLWMNDGCRDGNAESYWLSAQRQVLAESLGLIARVSVAGPDTASATVEKIPSKKSKSVPAKKKRRAA